MRKLALSLLTLSTYAALTLSAAPQDPDPYKQLDRLRQERERGTQESSTGEGTRATTTAPRSIPLVGRATWGKTRVATTARANHDSASVMLRSIAAGTYLRISEEIAGHFRAEIPGGFPAWIHETLVAPSELQGQLKVTATRVYVRTSPSRTATAVEPERFEPGDKLLVQDRQGEFFQVITPTRIQAWVPAADVELIADTPENDTEWRLQAVAYAKERVADMNAFTARAEESSRAAEVKRKYAVLHQRVADEAAKGANADLNSLYAAYGALRTENSSAELVPEYQHGMDLLDKAKILVEAEHRKAELQKEMEEAKDAATDLGTQAGNRAKTEYADPVRPVGIRREYQEFGWLRQRGGLLDQPVYFELERGSQRSFYVECPSGRYDLSDFADREIAIAGDTRETPRGAIFEVRRIRILSSPR